MPAIARLGLGALALLLAAPAAAQEAQAPAPTHIDSILRVLRLPRTTQEARQTGVPDTKIGGVLDVLRRGGVSAGDAEEVIAGEVAATVAGQPKDNFGAFVQEQHRLGKRGRALAAAIHAEHARRGIGRGKAKVKPRGGPDAGSGGEGEPAAGRGRGGKGADPTSGARQPRGRPDTASSKPRGNRP